MVRGWSAPDGHLFSEINDPDDLVFPLNVTKTFRRFLAGTFALATASRCSAANIVPPLLPRLRLLISLFPPSVWLTKMPEQTVATLRPGRDSASCPEPSAQPPPAPAGRVQLAVVGVDLACGVPFDLPPPCVHLCLLNLVEVTRGHLRPSRRRRSESPHAPVTCLSLRRVSHLADSTFPTETTDTEFVTENGVTVTKP